jgi:hypothetical protein
MMQDIEINAIHEMELKEFLNNIGILEDINKGMIKCIYCGEIITINNFHCVFPLNGEIFVCCENMACRMKSKIQYEAQGD